MARGTLLFLMLCIGCTISTFLCIFVFRIFVFKHMMLLLLQTLMGGRVSGQTRSHW